MNRRIKALCLIRQPAVRSNNCNTRTFNIRLSWSYTTIIRHCWPLEFNGRCRDRSFMRGFYPWKLIARNKDSERWRFIGYSKLTRRVTWRSRWFSVRWARRKYVLKSSTRGETIFLALMLAEDTLTTAIKRIEYKADCIYALALEPWREGIRVYGQINVIILRHNRTRVQRCYGITVTNLPSLRGGDCNRS